MKKILIVCLAILFLFVFTGCSEPESDEQVIDETKPAGKETEEIAHEITEPEEEWTEPQYEKSDMKAILVRKASIPWSKFYEPVVNGEDIYFAVGRDGILFEKLIKYNVDTEESEVLFDPSRGKEAIEGVMVNSKWLTWVGSSAIGKEKEVFAKNLETGDTVSIAASDSERAVVTVPFLYEDFVIWVSSDEEGEKVILYNLLTDESEVIGKIDTLGAFNSIITAGEGKVIWTNKIGQTGYYNIYDIEKKVLTEYASEFGTPAYTSISGSKVFSMNFSVLNSWTSQISGYIEIDTGIFIKMNDEYINRIKSSDECVGILKNNEVLELYDTREESLKIIDIDIPFEGNMVYFFTNDYLVLYSNEFEGDSTDIYVYQIKAE